VNRDLEARIAELRKAAPAPAGWTLAQAIAHCACSISLRTACGGAARPTFVGLASSAR
jgi:hypothetical protein